MMEFKTINVLYVDDEVNNLEAFRATFRRDFNVFTAISAKEAEGILDAENDIHILITDQRMPLKSGTELLAESVRKYPHQIRILLTAYADVECLEQAINIGHVHRFLKKPWDDAKLKEEIEEGYDVFVMRKKEKELTLQYQQTINELALILKQQKDAEKPIKD